MLAYALVVIEVMGIMGEGVFIRGMPPICMGVLGIAMGIEDVGDAAKPGVLPGMVFCVVEGIAIMPRVFDAFIGVDALSSATGIGRRKTIARRRGAFIPCGEGTRALSSETIKMPQPGSP